MSVQTSIKTIRLVYEYCEERIKSLNEFRTAIETEDEPDVYRTGLVRGYIIARNVFEREDSDISEAERLILRRRIAFEKQHHKSENDLACMYALFDCWDRLVK